MLLWDEPSTATEDGVIIAWAKAIHAAGAGPLVWEDPCYRDMSKATPEMLALCDVLTPDRNIFMHEPDAYRDAFMQQKARGARLDFYSCTGPARLLDPYAYFRIQAWDCWRFGAVSSYFWSFDDAAGVSSWNEYTAQRHAYAPLFLDKTSVTPGKHMEACREGVEDYEYLVMLKEAVEKAPASKADAAARGRALLEELPAKVGTAFPREADYRWRPSGNPTPADEARIEILDVLGELAQ